MDIRRLSYVDCRYPFTLSVGERNGKVTRASDCQVSGTPDAESPSYSNVDTKGDHIMPYLLGWLLGVPLIVLVILYLIFH
jgi:hypothetical protein